MSEAQWAAAAALFADLLELPEADRERTLTDRTEGDPSLRTAVERLLRAHQDAATEFLDPLDEATIRAVLEDVQAETTTAGPYRLVREIGRGGMGTVHLGERADGQFEQRVAVKMLKRGMDSEAILERFLRERQILAGLQHPNIAKLTDGGIAEDGRPYLVMEYVQGQPITTFCDDRRLPIDQRLDLFQRVCDAVAHAHRNLVVHRDLKPSNILVTDDGQTKLLDFGIAKVLEGDQAPGSATTQVGVRLMTPEYAAPEQIMGQPVTTSTDVFSLGVVLFELLSGRRPFGSTEDAGRLTGEPTDRLASSILDVIDESDASHAAAAARATDIARLRKRLSGDLATIVAKALRPEPDRRYPTVGALQDDLRRHERQLPIAARPATARYRVSRFVRRHRAGVGAAAAIGVLLLAFAATATTQALRIRSQALNLEAERDRAQVEAATAEEVAQFVMEVFHVADPLETTADSLTARALLDRGAERIQTELGTDPVLRARLLDVIANAYLNLLLLDQAEELALASVDARREAWGADDPRVAESLRLLGRIRTRGNDFDAAEEALTEAIALQESLAQDDVASFGALADYSALQHTRGNHRDASELAKQVAERFALLRAGGGGLSREELWEVAAVISYAGDWDGAYDAYERLAVLEAERGGPMSGRTAQAFGEQAGAELGRGNLDAADSLFDRALRIRRAVSPDDVETGQLLLRHGDLARRRGDLERADSLMRGGLAVYRSQLPGTHLFIANAEMAVGQVALPRERFAQAVQNFDRAADIYRVDEGPEGGVMLPIAIWNRGKALMGLGRMAEAEVDLRSALESFEGTYPDEYILTANVRRDLGACLIETNQGSEAARLLEAALAVLIGRWGKTDVRADDVRVDIAKAYAMTGRMDEARAILAEVVPRLEEERGAGDRFAQRAKEVAASLAEG